MQRPKRKLGPAQSPVVSATLAKKRKDVKARHAFKWALWSILTALVIALDRYFFISAFVLTGMKLLLLQCLELLVLAVLLLSFLYDVVLYMSVYITSTRIKLTDIQKKLLGIKEKASGYMSVPSPSPFGVQLASTPVTNQHTHTSPLHYMTPTGSGYSPYHTTPQSGSNAGSRTPTPSSSWRIQSFSKGSPYDNGRISDYSSLEKYLSSEWEHEQKLHAGSPDVAMQTQGGLYGSEFAPTPRRYHLSTRSHSPHGREKDSPLNSEAGTVSQALNKLGIKRDDLNIWTDRCRKWLATRVICPIAKEIDNINSTFKKLGSSDLQIGSVTLASLQQTAKTKVHQVPTLGLLMPYLELSTKQDYLVGRIQELSKGSYLSAFHWNSGGLWKGQGWEASLPNDSQIIMHLFCAYLDSQFPPNPQYPADGKAFSSRYFLKSPEKPSSKKSEVCIYQESINPPQYKVLLKEKCIDLSQGRNNIFHTIVVFLHCIKALEKSTLGQVNLETSGLNILWIIEPN